MPVDPFGTSGPDDDDGDGFNPDSGNVQMKEVRDWGKSLERKLKAQEKDMKELEALREFKKGYDVDVKSTEASKVFEKFGLPAAQAKLFVKESQEVSEDAVRKFAADYGLAVTEPTAGVEGEKKVEVGSGTTEPPAPQGYRPVGGQGSEGFVDGSFYTSDDIENMLKSGQADRVSEIVQKGRTKLEKLDEEYGYVK